MPNINQNSSKKPKVYNKQFLIPALYKKRKLIPQEKIQDTALKMTKKLAKLNYRDTGFLSNTTAKKKTILYHYPCITKSAIRSIKSICC